MCWLFEISSELFSRSRRNFSSGCIRVEKPAELAAWVLRNNPGWTVERVQRQVENELSGRHDPEH
jgi:L,D-transpeptidase YcbB